MRIKNKEIRRRRHRKEVHVKSVIKELKAGGKAKKPVGAAVSEPVTKTAPVTAEAVAAPAKKPAAPKKAAEPAEKKAPAKKPAEAAEKKPAAKKPAAKKPAKAE